MSWMERVASSDRMRIQNNISRLEALKTKIHELGYFAVASQSGGYKILMDILDDNLVLGREKVHEKLKSALTGENNSKLILDAPTKFQGIMIEAEDLIQSEIHKEEKNLRVLLSETNDKTG